MMDWLAEHRPFALTIAVALGLAAALMFRGGFALLAAGLRDPDHPDQSLRVVRGLRRGIIAIGLLFLAGGFYWNITWPFIFAAVFLGEELFETGIMILALRLGKKTSGKDVS